MRTLLLFLLSTIMALGQPAAPSIFTASRRSTFYVTPTNFVAPTTNFAVTFQAWWKADTFSLTNNAPVGDAGREWTDSSGNSKHATNWTAASQPTYVTNQINGKPVIRFDGTDDVLRFPSIPSGASNFVPYTILLVGRERTSVDQYILGMVGNNFQYRANYPSIDRISFYGALNLISSDTMESLTNTACLISMTHIGGSSAVDGHGTNFFRQNKISRGLFLGGNAFIFNEICKNDFGQGAWDIAELIIYMRFLSEFELDCLYDHYFRPRYGLPWDGRWQYPATSVRVSQ